MARPRKEVPVDELEELARFGMSAAAIGASFGVSADTIERRIRELGIDTAPAQVCYLHRPASGRVLVSVPVDSWPWPTGYRTRRGRRVVVPRSHAIWNAAHPDDPVELGENVHHANGDWTDDRLANLEVLTAAEHGRRHRLEEARHRAAA